MTRRTIIMTLTYVTGLILNVLRQYLRLHGINIYLRVKMNLNRNRRLTRHANRRIINFRLNLKHNNLSNNIAHTSRNKRHLLLILNMTLSNLSRIKSRIITTLRLHVSILPNIVSTIALNSRIIMSTNSNTSGRGSGGSTSSSNGRSISISGNHNNVHRLPLMWHC